jgi:YVTN family beta-propeller protein
MKSISATIAVFLLALPVLGQQVETTILLPDSLGGVVCPWAVNYSPASHRWFVTGFDRTLMIDGLTGERLSVIPVGSEHPTVTTYNPVNDRIYIGDYDRINIIDCRTGQHVATVHGAGLPYALCVNTKRNKVYVGYWSPADTNGHVAVIDAQADTLLTSLQVGTWRNLVLYDSLHDVAYSVNHPWQPYQNDRAGPNPGVWASLGSEFHGLPVRRSAARGGRRPEPRHHPHPDPFVELRAGSLPIKGEGVSEPRSRRSGSDIPAAISAGPTWIYGKVYVIDGKENTVTDSIGVGYGPDAPVISFTQHKLLVGCYDGTIWVLNTDSLSLDTVLQITPPDNNPVCAVWNPVADKVYFGTWEEPSLLIYDCRTDSLVAATQTPFGSPTAFAVDLLDNKVYAACKYGIAIIDGTTNALKWLDLNQFYSGVSVNDGAWNPDRDQFATSDNWLGDRIWFIDCRTDTIVADLDAGAEPRDRSAVWNPATNKVYVANGYDHRKVTVIDGATNRVIKVIETNNGPWHLCLNSRRNKIYADGDSVLAIIDGERDSVIKLLSVPWMPFRTTVYNPLDDAVYLVGQDAEGMQPDTLGLFVVDGASDSIVRVFGSPGQPSEVSAPRAYWEPRHDELYVSTIYQDTWGRTLGCIRVYQGRGDSMRLIDTIRFSGDYVYLAGVGDTLRSKIYCFSCAYSEPWRDSLCVIDGNTHSVVKRLHVEGGIGAVWNARMSRLYFRHADSLCVFSTTQDTFLRGIPLLSGMGAAVTLWLPRTNRILTSSSESRKLVFVVDCDLNQVINTITCDWAPSAFARNDIDQRIYVANMYGGSVTVLRDELGIGEQDAASHLLPQLSCRPLPISNAGLLSFMTPSPVTRLAIYDATGRRIADLTPEVRGRQSGRLAWNPENLATGICFARLETESGSVTCKVVVTK